MVKNETFIDVGNLKLQQKMFRHHPWEKQLTFQIDDFHQNWKGRNQVYFKLQKGSAMERTKLYNYAELNQKMNSGNSLLMSQDCNQCAYILIFIWIFKSLPIHLKKITPVNVYNLVSHCNWELDLLQKPQLITGSATLSEFLQRYCPVVTETYYPTFWCWEARVQTLLRPFITTKPWVEYRKYASLSYCLLCY